MYNTKAVGGTNSTATHNCLYLHAEYQSYDIKRAWDELTVVLFLFPVFSCHSRKIYLPDTIKFHQMLIIIYY